MKDLLLYVADADAQAFMESILRKPQALSIRPLNFHIERHPQKDSGMVQSGAELARMKKKEYQKVLLLWDHHGSGQDHKQSPEEVQNGIQKKLDSFTLSNHSAVFILVPELEQWLWFCENALLAHYKIAASHLLSWIEEHAKKLGCSMEELKSNHPKELFEHIMRYRLKRTISPRDFKEIGKRAGINELMRCANFQAIVKVLQRWFPQNNSTE